VAQHLGLKDIRLGALDFEKAGNTGYEVGEADAHDDEPLTSSAKARTR
jgi:hypothetical protein